MADDKFIQTFFGEDKFEQGILSEIKNFWDFNSNEIEVFMIKGKPKSIINLYLII